MRELRPRGRLDAAVIVAGGYRREALWLALLLVAESADLFTTRFGMAHGTYEANPMAGWLLSHGLLEAVKLGAVAAMVVIVLAVMRLGSHGDANGPPASALMRCAPSSSESPPWRSRP